MTALKNDLNEKMSSVFKFVTVVNGVFSEDAPENDEEMPLSQNP